MKKIEDKLNATKLMNKVCEHNDIEELSKMIATFLIEEYNAFTVENKIYLYTEDNIYIAGEEAITEIERVIDKCFPEWSYQKQNRLLKQILFILNNHKKTLPDCSHLIAFKNGVYNLKTKTLLPFSKDYILFNKINWKYNPDAIANDVDIVLREITSNDTEKREKLEELIGYALCRCSETQPIFLLYGKDEDGIDLFLIILNKLIGEYKATFIRKWLNPSRKKDKDFLDNKLLINCYCNKTHITTGLSQIENIYYNKMQKYTTLILNCPFVAVDEREIGKSENIVTISFDRKLKDKIFEFENISDKLVDKIRNGSDEELDVFMSCLINLGIHKITEKLY